MLRKSKFAVAAAVVLLASSFTLTGCAAAVGAASCDINVQNPHQSSGSPRYMDAKATITCSATVTNVSATIKLQKKNGSSWVDVAGSEGTNTKSSLAANAKLVVMTGGNLRCVNGTYRAAGKGSATYQGKSNGSAVWQYGSETSVVCK